MGFELALSDPICLHILLVPAEAEGELRSGCGRTGPELRSESLHSLPLFILGFSSLPLPLAGLSCPPPPHDLHGHACLGTPTAPALASLEHLARDAQLLQLHVLAQLTQVIHIEDLLPKLEAAEGGKGMGQGAGLLRQASTVPSAAHPEQTEAQPQSGPSPGC